MGTSTSMFIRLRAVLFYFCYVYLVYQGNSQPCKLSLEAFLLCLVYGTTGKGLLLGFFFFLILRLDKILHKAFCA